VILLAAGMDATVLFETYHPRGVPSAVVDKLCIGTMDSAEEFKSFYSWDSEFYPVLKKRVVQKLEEVGADLRGGSGSILFKAMWLLIGFWYALFRMYTASTFTEASAWSVTMGIFASFIGTCIQHDGNHGAFSKRKWVNKVAGWTLDMIGASGFTWEIQHMLGHHPYTNVLDCHEDAQKQKGVDSPLHEKDQESDPDVFSSFPLMRMHPTHTPSWFHKYQHLYAPLLFSLMTVAKVFQQDFEVAMSKRLYHIDAHCRYGSVLNLLRFWLMKVVSLGYMVAIPCYFHGAWRGIALFMIGHFSCGEMLATMFIVNHVIEGVSFGQTNSAGLQVPTTVEGSTPMEQTRAEAMKKRKDLPEVPLNDWAAVQCQTSVNWSPGSWFWNHFSGGLSHQIEHHLFPSICHTNYVHLHEVVKQTCEEYGVPYQSEPDLYTAYGKMISHLKFMGREKAL